MICKEDGIIAGLQIFERVFTLLDEKTQVEFFVKDGEKVKKGQTLAVVTGDIGYCCRESARHSTICSA